MVFQRDYWAMPVVPNIIPFRPRVLRVSRVARIVRILRALPELLILVKAGAVFTTGGLQGGAPGRKLEYLWLIYG